MSFLARVMSFLNRGSAQFIPNFDQTDVILTILKLYDDSLDLLTNQNVRNDFDFGGLSALENQ